MALTEQQQQTADDLQALVGDIDLSSDELYARYVASGSDLNAAAAEVWAYKASQAADLIDVKEGSSTRNLSQLRTTYLDMSDRFRALAAGSGAGAASAVTRTRPIVRRSTYPAGS